MELMRSVDNLVSEISQAIYDAESFVDKLAEKTRELEEAKDNLEVYLVEAKAAIAVLESFSAGHLDDALEEATSLID